MGDFFSWIFFPLHEDGRLCMLSSRRSDLARGAGENSPSTSRSPTVDEEMDSQELVHFEIEAVNEESEKLIFTGWFVLVNQKLIFKTKRLIPCKGERPFDKYHGITGDKEDDKKKIETDDQRILNP